MSSTPSDLASAPSVVTPGRRGRIRLHGAQDAPWAQLCPERRPPSRPQCPEEPPGDLARLVIFGAVNDSVCLSNDLSRSSVPDPPPASVSPAARPRPLGCCLPCPDGRRGPGRLVVRALPLSRPGRGPGRGDRVGSGARRCWRRACRGWGGAAALPGPASEPSAGAGATGSGRCRRWPGRGVRLRGLVSSFPDTCGKTRSAFY